jgi:hypothetical protein
METTVGKGCTIDLKVKDLYWIIGHKSIMSLDSKVLLYNTINKPIWNRTMGLRQQVEHCNNAAKPVQNTEDDNKCTMVRNQPDPARGLKVPYITEVIQGVKY